jgi:hypothetical protein
VLLYYLGRSDYYSETQLQIPVAMSIARPALLHRLTGSPLIYTVEELKEVLNRNPLMWVIIPAAGGDFFTTDFLYFLDTQMSVVYEDQATLIYQWKR